MSVPSPASAPRPRTRSVVVSIPAVVIGAGPYGLATSAHLSAQDVEHRIFGEPMTSWANHMPKGMRLRSRYDASHIADPDHGLSLASYEREHGLDRVEPVPVERFVDYGRWFQRRAVSHLEQRRVASVSTDGGRGFHVELVDGERLHAHRVVVAAGIVPFAYTPPVFEGVDHVTHSAHEHDLSAFAGTRVAVVGGGQSAVESAALLAEGGAEVELLLRADGVRWLPEGDQVNVDRAPRRFYAYSRIALAGPEGAWLVALPAAWRFMSRERRLKLALRVIRPAAAGWLYDRMENVTITGGHTVDSAVAAGGRVRLGLDDGSRREFDHVLLATGYRPDITRYEFLDRDLVGHVATWRGHPVLRSGFGSSVRGLHFMGASAMPTFGPVMRFVCGTWAAARGLTRGIVGRRAPRAGFSW